MYCSLLPSVYTEWIYSKKLKIIVEKLDKESRMVIDFDVWCNTEQVIMTGIKFNEDDWLKDLDFMRELWRTDDVKLFYKETKKLFAKHDRDWGSQALKTENRLNQANKLK